MSPEGRALYEQVLEFCRSIVSGAAGHRRRVRYWAAVAILRCVLSSPAAAEATLRRRMERLDPGADDDAEAGEAEFIAQVTDSAADRDSPPDYVPSAALNDRHARLSPGEIRQLNGFLEQARQLAGPGQDPKLAGRRRCRGRNAAGKPPPHHLLPLHPHRPLRGRTVAVNPGRQASRPDGPLGHRRRRQRRTAPGNHPRTGATPRPGAGGYRLPQRGHQPARPFRRRAALRSALESQPPGAARGPGRPLQPDPPGSQNRPAMGRQQRRRPDGAAGADPQGPGNPPSPGHIRRRPRWSPTLC